MAGVEHAISVNIPLEELLYRLEITPDPRARAEAKRIQREAAAISRRWDRESLGLRNFEEVQLESRKRAKEEQAREQEKRKPVQSERRSRKRANA